jgi:hypothetical protein
VKSGNVRKRDKRRIKNMFTIIAILLIIYLTNIFDLISTIKYYEENIERYVKNERKSIDENRRIREENKNIRR